MLVTNPKNRNDIVIFPDEMKKIACYETDFRKFGNEDLLRYSCPMRYRMTVADLQSALVHMKFAAPSVQEVVHDWLMPLVWLWDAFGLNISCGARPAVYKEKEMKHLPADDKDVFERIWFALEKALTDCPDQLVSVNEVPVLQVCIDCLTSWQAEREKPITDRNDPEVWQKAFVRYYAEHMNEIPQLNQVERTLCAAYTDALCKKSYIPALQVKAYSCYGGNVLYACDWLTSCNLLRRLLELTDDGVYANSLGYIYFYGRINDDVPQFDAAFRMFVQGAANGINQSVYKLGDMYLHGYGCTQSNTTASHLYQRAYRTSLAEFSKGFNEEMADTALRMARIYERGIGVSLNYPQAYQYLLLARYAMHRKTDFSYGDLKVWQEIREEITAMRSLLPEGCFRPRLSYDNAWFFEWFLEDTSEVHAELKKSENQYVITLKRPENADPKLFLEGRLDSCTLCHEITFTADGVSSSLSGNTGKWTYDRVQWNHVKQYFEFLRHGKIICWLKCERCYYQLDRPTVTLARVHFSPKGKTYDYLCSLADVHAWDKVLVEGGSVVEVTAIWHCALDDLPLPYHYYKKVLKKEPDGSSAEEDR